MDDSKLGKSTDTAPYYDSDGTSDISTIEEEVSRHMEKRNGIDPSDDRLEENKLQIIKAVLRQVKLGTPVYRCQLPIFVLEPRSLLEKLSDFGGFSHFLLGINEIEDPLQRFIQVTKFYLSAWHLGPKGVKNPFNPILGETFKCQWKHDDSTTEFVSEQISHHPPSSAFCIYNKEKRTALQAYLKPQTRLTTNGVEATLAGSLRGYLYKYSESYEMTFPKYMVRGILIGSMHIDLEGKTYIQCDSSGYNADIDFRGKKDKLVVGEIRNKEKKKLFTIEGAWNGVIHITDHSTNEKKELIDITKMESTPRITTPLEQQAENESLKVWGQVTKFILENNEDEALAAKSKIENEQRAKKITKFEPNLFKSNGDTYEYPPLSDFFGSMPTIPSTEEKKEDGGWFKRFR
eukprot:TRINITY_DN6639_c0_g1_i1.p1 TRINITY_DN6639_c0_g1~~TRINITY_DN6639_c0_g1_i1.p1  ORF type:complete len:404 (+),score=93.38 TRINITY_DN6639_c0_g1_i1:72-1283(+)